MALPIAEPFDILCQNSTARGEAKILDQVHWAKMLGYDGK